MGFEGGVKAAAKMLSALAGPERERLLKIISDKNPDMAKLLKASLVSFEDLQHITPKMMVELLARLKVDEFALSMRLASLPLRAHILGMLPSGIKKQIEDVLLGPPQLVSKAQEAQEKVMEVVREMCDKGELVLKSHAGDDYV